jgi:hypothetical protein
MNFERSGLSGVKAKATDKLPADVNRSSGAQYTDSW